MVLVLAQVVTWGCASRNLYSKTLGMAWGSYHSKLMRAIICYRVCPNHVHGLVP